jgi:hypothetical protein
MFVLRRPLRKLVKPSYIDMHTSKLMQRRIDPIHAIKVLADESQVSPVGNSRNEGDNVGEGIDRIDPQHKRIGESFALGRRVSEHMPIDLVREEPNLGGNENDHGDDPRTHADVDR